MNRISRFIIGAFVALAGVFGSISTSGVALAAQPTPPVISPGPGYHNSAVMVGITPDAIDAYCTAYTTDGSDPSASVVGGVCTADTGSLYSAPFSVDGANGTVVTVKAISLDVDSLVSTESSAAYTFDKVAPIISGVVDGSFVNVNVLPTFADASFLTTTLNGSPYVQGTTISAEGHYTLVATDAAGNTASVSFTIDKTAPSIATLGANPYGLEVMNPFNDPGFSAYDLNGIITTWTTGGLNTAVVGTYTITYYAMDAAGNTGTTTRTVVVSDTSFPVVSGALDGHYYNVSVTITFTDTNSPSATLNGVPFASGQEVTSEGVYTLIVTDLAGNTTTVHFVIDKTDPLVTGVADGVYYNANVTVGYSDANLASATLNGSPFAGGVVSTEGHYTLVVTDLAGNVTTVAFTIDKTAPVVTGVTIGSYYNVDVTVGYSDDHLFTATLNGAPFAGGVVSLEGHYTLVVTDLAGNITTVSFTIDKTAPSASLSGTEGLPGYYRSDVTVTFSDDHLASATLNGVSVTSGYVATIDGVYTLVVTDLAGNVTTLTFTVDKTVPIVLGVSDGTYHNHSLTVTYSDTNIFSAYLNGVLFVSGTTVSLGGEYTLVVTDMAGNVTTVHFVIDYTIPTVTGVTDGGYYNTDVTVGFSDPYLDGATLNGVPFLGGVVSAEGHYTLVVWDLAGNTITVTFTIDKTNPLVSGVTDGAFYNYAVTIGFSDDHFGGATLNGVDFAGGLVSAEGSYTLDVWDLAGNHTIIHFVIHYVDPVVTGVTDGAYYNHTVTIGFTDDYVVTATLNGIPFFGGDVTLAGVYTLIVTDEAGNSVTIHFVIDYTLPDVTGVSDGGWYNHGVTIGFSDPYLAGATLNGVPFAGGSVSAEGHYTLVVTDLAGNVTTITFSIDMTDPEVIGVIDGSYHNHSLTIGIIEDHFAWATLNGVSFAGGVVSAEGTYVLVVTDLAGNTITIHFVIDITAPVITVIGPNPYVIDVFSVYSDPGHAALDNFDGDLTSSVIVTGVVNTSILGEYLVTYQVTDLAGNVTTVTRLVRVVDRTKPVITLIGDVEITLEYGSTYTEFGATAFDNYDGDITGKIVVSGTPDTTSPGLYTIVYTVVDSSGNVSYIVRRVRVKEKPIAPVVASKKEVLGDIAVTPEGEIDSGATDEKSVDKNADKENNWDKLSSIALPVLFWTLFVGLLAYILFLLWPGILRFVSRFTKKKE